jgi:hypothetical protein
MDCHQARLSLGVLVLGVIDPDERQAVEAHLAGCGRCAAEMAELAVLPGLLHRVGSDVAASGLPPVPPSFQDRVLTAARVARARRRRRMVLGATAGAAVAAVLAAVLLLPGLGGNDDGSSPSAGRPVVVESTDPQTDVHARVDLAAEDSGTELTLVLSGVAPGERCRLVAHNTDGSSETAASWVATYTGSASVTGTTSFPRETITSLQIIRGDGKVLVSMPVDG